jgi:hypothetical protein
VSTQKVRHRGESIEVIVGGFARERTVQKIVGLGDEIWREIQPAPAGDLIFLMSFLRTGNGMDRSTRSWKLGCGRLSPGGLDPRVGAGHGRRTREQE